LLGIKVSSRDLTKKLFDFFPEFEKGDKWDLRKDKVSLHHVLSMRWGFDESGPSNNYRWYTENWISKTLRLQLISEPGEKFEYHSAAPALPATFLCPQSY
jgi:CubicO group peptidase (beta-lactamase class C family)